MMEDYDECLVRLSSSPIECSGFPDDFEKSKTNNNQTTADAQLTDASRLSSLTLSAGTLEVMQMLNDWQDTSAPVPASKTSLWQAGENESSPSLPYTSNFRSLRQSHSPTPSARIVSSPINTTDPIISESVSISLLLSASSTNTNALSVPPPAIMEASFSVSTSGVVDNSFLSKVQHSSLSINRGAIPEDPIITSESILGEDKMDVKHTFLVPTTTTLATRTTGDVIAQLKRLQPIPEQDPSKRQRYAIDPVDLPTLPKKYSPLGVEVESPDQEISEDEEDEAGPATRPRKVTERKRRLNATVDNYILGRTLKQIKEGTLVRPEDEINQSARWLVNQSEDRQIISTPREYQLEMFEKAKERNIIAVLDTGK